ncbi:replication endonuclease [Salinicola sp. LHM]|uniref:replication endonuclease n=1 Tax=Salinicola sp. LHM TaxID=3065298 RepID=UPI002ACE8639|nr:replication endonuclease [Salinicola sp. LHM]WQH33345.1 replication endonuclease [Salinicola sp. LHM]
MSALEQSLQFGTAECRQWRQAFFDRLPSLAEDLAAGFVHVANRHGNAAGNRWLARHAAGLIEPGHVYRRFAFVACDLRRAFAEIRRQCNTTIEGLKAGCVWLADVEKRLTVGSLNATHDDDALVDYAKAQALGVEDARNKLIGNIASHNRRLRLGLLPPPRRLPQPSGETISAQARHMATLIARARNPLTPPAPSVPLMAVFQWERAPVMSIAVADEMALTQARERARLHGITPPSPKSKRAEQIARLGCDKWWRRKLRRVTGRRIEQVMREARRVHKRAGIYCSDLTVERRRSQKVRNRALLETIEAINQNDQVYTLAELAELGLANPDHRRAELMLRIRDTEVEAKRLGHVGLFFTLTAPSRFHPVLASSSQRNPKYDGSTPREAQQYLQKLWAQARSSLARDGLGIYGIRVVEPHHDGTPHWHLLVWAQPDHVDAVTETLRSYAEAESPEELFDRFGNRTTARFKVETIDTKRGTAAGYIAKYISKNINGQQFARDGVEGDHLDNYGHELNDSAPRIEAWAATWGIRQFQFLGLPSVTVWREVRRLTEQQEDELKRWEEATRPRASISNVLRQIRAVALGGHWDQFVRLMGGPNTPRKDQPIKPWSIPAFRTGTGDDEFSHATGEVNRSIVERGRYGDEIKVPKGLVVKDHKGRTAEFLTRLYRWEVRPKRSAAGAGFSGGGEAADPWTCVNNCTPAHVRRLITPTEPDPETLAAQLQRYQEWRASEEVRAEMESVDEENRFIREQTRQLLENDAAGRALMAERGIHVPASPWAGQAEFFPDGI